MSSARTLHFTSQVPQIQQRIGAVEDRRGSAFGTVDPGFTNLMLSGIINTACDRRPGGSPEAGEINDALAAVTGIGARDEIEGMLATQMVATHVAAVRVAAPQGLGEDHSAGQ